MGSIGGLESSRHFFTIKERFWKASRVPFGELNSKFDFKDNLWVNLMLQQ